MAGPLMSVLGTEMLSVLVVLLLFPVLLNQPEESSSQKQVGLHPLQPSFSSALHSFWECSFFILTLDLKFKLYLETSISIPEVSFSKHLCKHSANIYVVGT